ncbi:hypothetical protein SH591_08600 [Sphingomonas sp. LY54]|uniref:hypothetical protein n=1 Tax=Sphingomonas sp. LY54 TaxID=3095343 RepID=UPI002D782553|nr:hypothetical protein [Sphingomonas sp. LY54]WRP27183.1 hypothetical protein SH591_08600 [Sphingomonas sp. LY54]
MITIGLRAAPRSVTFAVYDTDVNSILNVEEIRAPAAFATPNILKFLRINLLDVLREYKVKRAGIRLAEPMAQSPNLERIQIEAVMQEAFASSTLDGYFAGPIATITARLGMERSDFKPHVEGQREYPLEGWANMSPVQREAALCAVAAADV